MKTRIPLLAVLITVAIFVRFGICLAEAEFATEASKDRAAAGSGLAERPEQQPSIRTTNRSRLRMTCGNGRLERGERCDTELAPENEGACPTACDDNDACTTDVLRDAGTCHAHCVHVDWCADTPRSAYFQNDAMAEAILSGQSVYDLTTEFPSGCGHDLGAKSDDWGVKMLNGIKQGGFLNSLTCDTTEDRPAEKMLHGFQQAQGLPLSSILDRAAMTRLDEVVLIAEQRVARRDVAGDFPCWSVFREAPPLNSSKAHVAYLRLLAYESFPASLRLTADECFDPQLGMSNNGTVIWDSATWRDVAPDGSLREPYALLGTVSADDYTAVAMAVHEFAHVLDGDLYPYARPGGVPRIDTSEFIDISYEYSSRNQDGWIYYTMRPDPENSDEMRRHFFSYGVGWQHGTMPAYYTAAEDFATCVSMYILHGAVFRDYSAARPPLAAKYGWIREHVFNGVEFATGDPAYAAYAPDLWNLDHGLFDVTGFLQLRVLTEPGYAWDYSIPILANEVPSGEAADPSQTLKKVPSAAPLRVDRKSPGRLVVED